MVLVSDFVRKYVSKDHFYEFMHWGKWWDATFSLECFYEKDVMFSILKYAKGK